MKITTLILTSCLWLFAYSVNAQQFKIDGTSEGLADHTWLYLKTANEIKLDSCEVIGNKFNLKGQITETAQPVILHNSKFSNYVFFWLEPKTIQVTLKNNEFKKAIIKGSEAQNENERLAKLIEPFNKTIDSLSLILKTVKNDQGHTMLTYQAARKRQEQAYQQYVLNNPNSLIALYVLSVYSISWGKVKTEELFNKLTTTLKDSEKGKKIKDFIAYNQEISIGKKYLDFEQMSSTGKNIKLSSIRDKYILLEFWASWCGPCRAENPNLVKTYAEYKDKGFEIFGVSADEDKAAWLAAIKADNLPWNNVCDLKGDKNLAVLIYGISSFPTNYLIDRNGIIVAKNLRGEALKNKLAELLP